MNISDVTEKVKRDDEVEQEVQEEAKKFPLTSSTPSRKTIHQKVNDTTK